MFEKTRHASEGKIKLSGFNNLTKVVSFNFYDFCITLDDSQKESYVKYINEQYSAEKITEISEEICRIIEANILGVSKQNYDPVGASTMVLMSDVKGGGGAVSCHLDKSHITVHTYPDAEAPDGICSFRVDIDIATCGEIVPLNAINYLFKSFECDVVVVDYVVRGYTRLTDGTKIYNDMHLNSIKDFIDPEILADYAYQSDMNLAHAHTWQTKLRIKDMPATRYLFESADAHHPKVAEKMQLLNNEMDQVFHLMN